MTKGIDYGMGQTNIDRSNGIRYGVISQHSLAHWALGEFEADYGDPTCQDCGNPVIEGSKWRGHGEPKAEYRCTHCRKWLDTEDVWGDEPLGHYLDDGEYTASLDSYGDVFITKSPYYTHAQFCSPCAPGACHLDNPMPEGEKAYCFGHDWFEDNKAPYPVYRVDTGELVQPEC